jgi:hypothetical protein
VRRWGGVLKLFNDVLGFLVPIQINLILRWLESSSVRAKRVLTRLHTYSLARAAAGAKTINSATWCAHPRVQRSAACAWPGV